MLDPITLQKEIKGIQSLGVDPYKRLLVSKKAHLILPTHRWLDKASEFVKGKQKIGSTLKGIGPTYMDKTGRNGLRVGDLLSGEFDKKYLALKEKHLGLLKHFPDLEFDLEGEEKKWFEGIDCLRKFTLTDSEYYLNDALKAGKRILAEGAQGSMLDIDFGTYPYVTSSNTITAGVCTGLGISPSSVDQVIGITKAYCTRVGSGPFPTELFNEQGEKLRRLGNEFGATTGRPRRCGWLDIPQLKYTIMINGVTQLVMTKIDVLDKFDFIEIGDTYSINGEETDKIPFDLSQNGIKPNWEKFLGWNESLDQVTKFNELPNAAIAYIDTIEAKLGVPFTMISTGPEREKLLIKNYSSIAETIY